MHNVKSAQTSKNETSHRFDFMARVDIAGAAILSPNTAGSDFVRPPRSLPQQLRQLGDVRRDPAGLSAPGHERISDLASRSFFCSHPMKEYCGEYSDQGRHYEAESNSDSRVFGEPLSIAENVVNTSAGGCQLRPLDKLQALRQTCGDSRF